MYRTLYGNMVLKYLSTFFEHFQKMSQNCEQFSYGTFGGIFLGFGALTSLKHPSESYRRIGSNIVVHGYEYVYGYVCIWSHNGYEYVYVCKYI